MNVIDKHLLALGFSQKEIDIYMALLRLGRATPVELAAAAKIKRVTVYAITKNLTAKGIIAEDLAGKHISLVALPPMELGHLIEKEKRAIDKKETLVNQTIIELSQIFNTEKFSIPRIRFIEEKQLENHLETRIEDWSADGLEKDGICWGFQDHTFVDNYKKWLMYFWLHDNYGLTIKLLSNKSDTEQKLEGKFARREIKYWNKTGQFTASTWIVGNYVIMINTREHPFYLLEIKDNTLAHNLREVFKNLWDEIN